MLFNFILATAFTCLPFIPQGNGQVRTEAKPFDLCETANQAFKSGEEVVYTVYYNWNFVWLSAGEVTFKVEELPNAYKLTAKGRTFPSYEWFFKVRDYYEAIIDKKTLLPLKTIRDIKEGGYRLYEKVEYHEGGYTVTSHRGKESKKLTPKEFKLSGCTHDVLSSIYFARNQAFDGLSKGATFPVRVFLDREEYNLRIKYLGKLHKVEVKNQGTFRAIGLSPETVAGTVFSEGAVMTVYASDDANRIPLMIESPVSVGSIKAVLKSHKNLRYPLSSRLTP
ncbi:MAG: DUF3108 domain-containing protein [Saprospiraceae bacterium]|nr:DUF3108 domain-containing protein [Saprospiraceae bacterium]